MKQAPSPMPFLEGDCIAYRRRFSSDRTAGTVISVNSVGFCFVETNTANVQFCHWADAEWLSTFSRYKPTKTKKNTSSSHEEYDDEDDD